MGAEPTRQSAVHLILDTMILAFNDQGDNLPWEASNGAVLFEVEGNKKSRLILISFQVVDSWQSSNLHRGFQCGQLVDSLNLPKWSAFWLQDTFGRIPQSPAARISIGQGHVGTSNWISGPSRNCKVFESVATDLDVNIIRSPHRFQKAGRKH